MASSATLVGAGQDARERSSWERQTLDQQHLTRTGELLRQGATVKTGVPNVPRIPDFGRFVLSPPVRPERRCVRRAPRLLLAPITAPQ